MPRTPYTPTAADALTGQNVRALRQRAGETLKQTVERSGFGKDASTLAATERGERLLTDLEATKLAAHFGTTADMLRRFGTFAPTTEQEWLGNTATAEVKAAIGDAWPIPTAPALFAVPDQPAEPEPTPEQLQQLAADVYAAETLAPVDPRYFLIDLDHPMHPDEYRAQVWIPYLENRYAAETA
ncbi:hypothetical protein SEA_VIBAKI_62 [Arthrobacter phage Vibaki]|uniref:HTH cro/C1-type domain-containing protein n=1 Tax=Arthrobacter phage Vibaki TaxID=2593333 RepID=A0A514TZ17_9CAUD|nr:hypothetical protein HYP95_gp62 [Arthrobacter phage Vibaki]QDK01942.1 hypothetical protein SEA_VIBAKI_62 [Arthrobacter phage Vibaki]